MEQAGLSEPTGFLLCEKDLASSSGACLEVSLWAPSLGCENPGLFLCLQVSSTRASFLSVAAGLFVYLYFGPFILFECALGGCLPVWTCTFDVQNITQITSVVPDGFS